MSFPTVIYGEFGDQQVAQSTRIGDLPLGTPMDLPDGRRFRHVKMSATAGVVGKMYTAPAGVTDHGTVAGSGMVIATAVAVGDKTITLTTNGTTVVTKDQYADGYMTTVDGTGLGHVYRIESNVAASLAVTCTFTLSDPIAATVNAVTATVSLTKSPYKDILLTATGSARVGTYAGILPIAASANFYTWAQTRGPAAWISAATVGVIGEPLIASTGEAGLATNAVAATSAVTIGDVHHLARGMSVAAASGAILCDLIIE